MIVNRIIRAYVRRHLGEARICLMLTKCHHQALSTVLRTPLTSWIAMNSCIHNTTMWPLVGILWSHTASGVPYLERPVKDLTYPFSFAPFLSCFKLPQYACTPPPSRNKDKPPILSQPGSRCEWAIIHYQGMEDTVLSPKAYIPLLSPQESHAPHTNRHTA
jgi:hypothetical protein